MILCRICVKTIDENFGVNLFTSFTVQERNEVQQLAAMIRECASVQVLENDHLPQTLCTECVDRLTSSYYLKKQIIAADRQLRLLLKTTVKNEPNDSSYTSLVDFSELKTSDLSNTRELSLKMRSTTISKREPPDRDNIEQNKEHATATDISAFSDEVPDYTESDRDDDTGEQENYKLIDIQDNDLKPCLNSDNKHLASEENCSNLNDKKEMITSETASSFLSFDHFMSSENLASNGGEQSEGNVVKIKMEINKNKKQKMKSLNSDKKSQNCDKKSQNCDKKSKISNNSNYVRIKKFACDECNKLFTSRPRREWHVRNKHTGIKPFKCDTCEKGFANVWSLKVHKQIHSDEKPYPCEKCGKLFRYPSLVKVHMEVHSEFKMYKCDICSKSFNQYNSLLCHKKRHDDKNPVFCDRCGKQFKNKALLTSHLDTHKEKTVPCPVCGKLFVNKSQMNTHYRRHLGHRPYSCDICEKKFGDSNVLKNHKRIHEGSKPFKCTMCTKSFNQKTILTRHLRIHTGETPYPCTLCPARFAYTHYLLNHMKRYHPNNI